MCGFHYRPQSCGNCARVEMKQWRCLVGKRECVCVCVSVPYPQVSCAKFPNFFPAEATVHSESWQNTKLEQIGCKTPKTKKKRNKSLQSSVLSVFCLDDSVSCNYI